MATFYFVCAHEMLLFHLSSRKLMIQTLLMHECAVQLFKHTASTFAFFLFCSLHHAAKVLTMFKGTIQESHKTSLEEPPHWTTWTPTRWSTTTTPRKRAPRRAAHPNAAEKTAWQRKIAASSSSLSMVTPTTVAPHRPQVEIVSRFP